MLNLDDVYKKVEDNWVSRIIWDEVVIVPLCRSEDDMQFIYSISNETGSRLWQLLDGGHSVKDIQEILKSEYQGQGEVMEREVLEFIADLLEAKLIGQSEPRKSTVQNVHQSTAKKKVYKTPEIAKVRMQPEQAVLTCCLGAAQTKVGAKGANFCTHACFSDQIGCDGKKGLEASAVSSPAS